MPLHKDDPKSVGGYKLVDRLGAGGMGIVYRGRSRSGREVAVKVVHAQHAENKVFRARFRQEIESVRKVSGAFTAPVVDADPEAVRPWMATQYVPGRSLADRIRERGELKDTELRQLALGLVEALRDIHRAGVVHRDLKPANVLMAGDGPRVIDFGISRAAENHNTLTETGQMIGTPPFMSPEQFTDARTVGPASDVFSLGALLVFSTTGRGPFDTDSPYLTAFRVVHEAPVLDGVAQPLRAILERCLAKDPAERPELEQLAKEFADVLPEPDPADPGTVTLRPDAPRAVEQTYAGADPGAVTKFPRSRRRRRRVRPLLLTAGTAGAVALGLLWYVRFGPGFSDSPQPASASPTAASRWAAVPTGWQPWQTTMFKTAPRGETKPLGQGPDFGSDATCGTYEDAVYCAGLNILPVRLDGRTGETVWRSPLASADSAGTEQNSFTLLGVQDGAVLVRQAVYKGASVAGTSFVALDAKSGDQLWARKVNDTSVELTMADGLVLTTDSTGRLATARDLRTGTDRWTVQLPAEDYCQFLAVGTGLYEYCFPDDESQAAEFVELNRTDGSVVRRLETPNRSGLLGTVDGRLVFVVAGAGSGPARPEDDLTFGEILLTDPKTGVATTRKLTKSYEGTVTLAADTLLIAEADGKVTALSPLTGKELWQTGTSVEGSGRLTYDSRTRTLYLASPSGRVAALDARKGTLLWETGAHAEHLASSETVRAEVLLYGGALVVSTPDGTVFSLDPAHPGQNPG
ncbi:protein kinase [Streptomyces sp. NPDC019531]|uniref:serine/threonine-protein kinase n=1 Tax=Streptomyces sp. NPDC019531 TaxID=3365062 RepID=UPI00384F8B38